MQNQVYLFMYALRIGCIYMCVHIIWYVYICMHSEIKCTFICIHSEKVYMYTCAYRNWGYMYTCMHSKTRCRYMYGESIRCVYMNV